MQRIIFLIIFFLTSSIASAQDIFTIKGKVYDEITQEGLPGVSIGIKNLPRKGTFTDSEGNYKLLLPAGEYELTYKLLGYYDIGIKADIRKNKDLNISLKPEIVSLGEVEVTAEKRDGNIKDVQMGVEKLRIETINKLPVLLGERDILKSIQLLPGVQAAGEGNTGFYVRGGSDDQNLILLDNATVYNPSHLLGFFSTFNSDVVDDIALYKGVMPSQYGGRLSSILDVNMREGNLQQYDVSGGIGLISSKLAVEGPILKNRSSFIVSARRTYADAVGHAMGVNAIKSSTLYFYDLNAKVNYILSAKDKLTFTAYSGRDKLGLNGIVVIDWGNTLGTLKWNHRHNEKTSMETSLAATNYGYGVNIDLTDKFKVTSHIIDYNFNQNWNFFLNDKNIIRLGYTTIYHHIVPGDIKVDDPASLKATSFAKRNSWENAIFISHKIKPNETFEIDYGLRLSSFSVLGGGNFYSYDNKQNIIDTMTYAKGKIVKTYWNPEPRLSVAYQLSQKSSIKAAYARTVQNMHLLKVSNMETTPSDRWVTSNNYIKPEVANQISLGYFRNFSNNIFELGIEIYYKNLKNQIDYKDGTADILQKENIEPYLLFGKGRAYGLELFLKKRYGRFNGWVGYTLSRSEKKINGINDNDWYVSNQDRTHNISLVGMYEINQKWSLSGVWVYSSGSPMTFPSGKYIVDGRVIPYYEGRNRYRAPAYHRMDVGATCILKKTKNNYSELVFSLYNVYGRQNPYMYGFRQNLDNDDISETYMIYLFSIIPSVSWNFKF